MNKSFRQRFANLSLRLTGKSGTLNINRPVFNQNEFDEQQGRVRKRKRSLPHRLKEKIRGRVTCSRNCWTKFIFKFLPFINILREYNPREDLLGDVIAGLTVGIVNIPQGVAYAILATVPPIYGLYTSFFPVIIYFFFSTSRQNSVGTLAITALMVGSAVESQMSKCVVESSVRSQNESLYNITNNYTDNYNLTTSMITSTTSDWLTSTVSSFTSGFSNHNATSSYNYHEQTTSNNISLLFNGSYINNTSESVPTSDEQCRVNTITTLALLVGIIQLLMGVFRLGFITIYLADPLISGFTTGAACHILTSQVKYVLGIDVPRHVGAFKLAKTYISIFSKIGTKNWAEIVISIVCIVLLVLVKQCINDRFKKKIFMPVPIELIVVIGGILISFLADFKNRYGVKIIGHIPAKFPIPAVPSMTDTVTLLPNAFTISIVAFAITVSMAKAFAKKHKYEIDANQELVALGLTNGVSSFFSCFPSCASLSRSAVQDNQGGKTQIAGVISSILIFLVLIVLAPYFSTLPNSVLSSIILVALKGMLMQFSELKRLWHISIYDFLIWLITWLAVVIIDVDLGLGVGVLFGLLTVVFRTQYPDTSILARVPHTDLYKNKKLYPTTQEVNGVKIFRIDAALYYANVEHFRQNLYKLTTVNPRKLKARRDKIENMVNKELAQVEKKLKKEKKSEMKTKRRVRINTSYSAANYQEVVDIEELPQQPEFTDPSIIPANERMGWPVSPVHHIIIDCSMMSYVDSVGVNMLKSVFDEYKHVDITLLFASCQNSVFEMLRRCSFYSEVPEDNLYLTTHDAVIGALQHAHDQLDKVNLDTKIVSRPGSVKIKSASNDVREDDSSEIELNVIRENPNE